MLDDLAPHHSQEASSNSYGAHLFVALYDFHGNFCLDISVPLFSGVGEDQLSLRRGDQVRVLGYNKSKEWSECQLVSVKQRGSTGGALSAPVIGWVPSLYISPLNSLEKHNWYHGKLTRSEAEFLLSSGNPCRIQRF